MTDSALFDLVKRTIRADLQIVSPFDAFRSYLLSEEEIDRKVAKFLSENQQLSKISKLENPEFADEDWESRERVSKLIFPPSFSKSKTRYDRLNRADVDLILEKYVVLSYLVDDTFLIKLKQGVPYFQRTIFRELLGGLSNEALLNKIEKLDRKYKGLFDKLQNWEMQRVLTLPFVGHRRNSMQLDLNEKAGELLLDEAPVKYIHSVLDEEKQTRALFELYFKEVERMILADFENKRISFSRLLEFQRFSEGKFTANNVNTFRRYFTRANASLGLMNLPASFQKNRNVHGSH